MARITVAPMSNFWSALSLRRTRPKQTRKASALTALVAGVAAGAVLYIGVDGLYVKLTTPPPPMSILGSYLAQSALVRPGIQAAIISVQNCSESPAAGEAALQQAIKTRQDILNGLRTLSVAGLPNGQKLASTLTTAAQDSIAADKDYQRWMIDFAKSGTPCGSDPSQDSNYAAAVNASAAATTAKNDFVNIWNPMAPHYGQPTYSSTGF
jgi:hypothetical protein